MSDRNAEYEDGSRRSPSGVMGMCPHCGEDVPIRDSLTAYHDWPPFCRSVCPGSKQHPRCAESDARPLWNGEPNRRFRG